MKKILTLMLAFTVVSVTGFSQGRGKGKEKQKKHHAVKHNKKDRDDDWRKRNARYDDRRNRRYDDQAKYSKNIPAKVRAAFNRDFPNASNVQWTKDRGYWTANFGSGIFSRANSVTYKANGTRVTTTANSGIFRSDRDRVDTRTKRKKTPYQVMTRGPL